MEKENNENLDSKNKDSDQEADDKNLENTSEEEQQEESSKDDVEALKEKNKQLFARAKKAEDKLKKVGEATAEEEQEEEAEEKKPQTLAEVNPDEISKLVDQKLEERDLDSLDDSDEIKEEIKNLAKVKGVSIKEAEKDNYIDFLRKKDDGNNRADEASASSTKQTWAGKDFSKVSPLDFDRTTEEGEKEFQEYKKYLNTQG
jgi:ubiquitin